MKTKIIILLKIAFTASIVAFLLTGCEKGTPELNPEPDPTEEQTEPREVVRLKSFGEVGGATANFSYNNAGFLTKVESEGEGEYPQGTVKYKISSSYTYDAENKITKMVALESATLTDDNGTIYEEKEEETFYHYNNKGKIIKVDFPISGDKVDHHIEVLYNDDDQVIETIKRDIRTVGGSSETKTSESRTSYEYNASGRIKSDGSMNYTYDSRGNIIEGIPHDSGTSHYYETYDDGKSMHAIIANSMGITDRLSMIYVPSFFFISARRADHYYLNYYNPNNLLTHKLTINGEVHYNSSFKYAYNEDGYPITIEYIKRSPTMPWYNGTQHFTLTYEKITIE